MIALYIPVHFKVTGYRGGVVFLSTSTASSYCTVVLPEAESDTVWSQSYWQELKEQKEICNSRGCVTYGWLPPCDLSRQKFDLAQKIKRRRLWSLCAVSSCSKWLKLFCLAFTVWKKWKLTPHAGKKSDLVSSSRPNNFSMTRQFEETFHHLLDKAFAHNLVARPWLNRWAQGLKIDEKK